MTFQFRLCVLLVICVGISFKVRVLVIFRVNVRLRVRFSLW